jgi:hypothetical protein
VKGIPSVRQEVEAVDTEHHAIHCSKREAAAAHGFGGGGGDDLLVLNGHGCRCGTPARA